MNNFIQDNNSGMKTKPCPSETDIATFLSNVKDIVEKEAEELFGKSNVDVALYAELKYEVVDIERFAFDPVYLSIGIPLNKIHSGILVTDPVGYAQAFAEEHIFDLVHELGHFFDGINRGIDVIRNERKTFMKDNPDIPKALYNSMESELAAYLQEVRLMKQLGYDEDKIIEECKKHDITLENIDGLLKAAGYEDLYAKYPVEWTGNVIKDDLSLIPDIKKFVDDNISDADWENLAIGFWSYIPFYDESNLSVLLPLSYYDKIMSSSGSHPKEELPAQIDNNIEQMMPYLPENLSDKEIEEMSRYWDWGTPGTSYSQGLSDFETRMILHELNHYADHIKRGEEFVKETTEYFLDPAKTEIDKVKYLDSNAEQKSFIVEIEYMRSHGANDADIVHEMKLQYGGEEEYWKKLVGGIVAEGRLKKVAFNIGDKVEERYEQAQGFIGSLQGTIISVANNNPYLFEVLIDGPNTIAADGVDYKGRVFGYSSNNIKLLRLTETGETEKERDIREWEERNASLNKQARYYFEQKGWRIITPEGDHIEIEAPDGGTLWMETMPGRSDNAFWNKSSGIDWVSVPITEQNKIADSFTQYVKDKTGRPFWFERSTIEPMKKLDLKETSEEKDVREWEERWNKKAGLSKEALLNWEHQGNEPVAFYDEEDAILADIDDVVEYRVLNESPWYGDEDVANIAESIPGDHSDLKNIKKFWKKIESMGLKQKLLGLIRANILNNPDFFRELWEYFYSELNEAVEEHSTIEGSWEISGPGWYHSPPVKITNGEELLNLIRPEGKFTIKVWDHYWEAETIHGLYIELGLPMDGQSFYCKPTHQAPVDKETLETSRERETREWEERNAKKSGLVKRALTNEQMIEDFANEIQDAGIEWIGTDVSLEVSLGEYAIYFPEKELLFINIRPYTEWVGTYGSPVDLKEELDIEYIPEGFLKYLDLTDEAYEQELATTSGMIGIYQEYERYGGFLTNGGQGIITLNQVRNTLNQAQVVKKDPMKETEKEKETREWEERKAGIKLADIDNYEAAKQFIDVELTREKNVLTNFSSVEAMFNFVNIGHYFELSSVEIGNLIDYGYERYKELLGNPLSETSEEKEVREWEERIAKQAGVTLAIRKPQAIIDDIKMWVQKLEGIKSGIEEYLTGHGRDVSGDEVYEFNIKIYAGLPEWATGGELGNEVSGDEYFQALADQLESYVDGLKETYPWISEWGQVGRMGGWLVLTPDVGMLNKIESVFSDADDMENRLKDWRKEDNRDALDVLQNAKDWYNEARKRLIDLRDIEEKIDEAKKVLERDMGTYEFWGREKPEEVNPETGETEKERDVREWEERIAATRQINYEKLAEQISHEYPKDIQDIYIGIGSVKALPMGKMGQDGNPITVLQLFGSCDVEYEHLGLGYEFLSARNKKKLQTIVERKIVQMEEGLNRYQGEEFQAKWEKSNNMHYKMGVAPGVGVNFDVDLEVVLNGKTRKDINAEINVCLDFIYKNMRIFSRMLSDEINIAIKELAKVEKDMIEETPKERDVREWEERIAEVKPNTVAIIFRVEEEGRYMADNNWRDFLKTKRYEDGMLIQCTSKPAPLKEFKTYYYEIVFGLPMGLSDSDYEKKYHERLKELKLKRNPAYESPEEKEIREWEERIAKQAGITYAAFYSQMWIDPSGEEHPVDERTGHIGWIIDNLERLKTEYNLDVMEILDEQYKDRVETQAGVIEHLLEAGWVRVAGTGAVEVWDINDSNTLSIVDDYAHKHKAPNYYIDHHKPQLGSFGFSWDELETMGFYDVIKERIKERYRFGKYKISIKSIII